MKGPDHDSRRQRRQRYRQIAYLLAAISIAELSISPFFRSEKSAVRSHVIIDYKRNRPHVPITKGAEDQATAVLAASRSSEASKRRPRYETDELCPYCRYAFASPKKHLTCNLKILKDLHFERGLGSIDKEATYLEAAINLANDESGYCTRCDPAACTAAEKIYYRIDAVAPTVRHAVTHHLSIPARHRIPATALDDLATHQSIKEQVYPARRHFVETNPSLVQLPATQRTSDEAVYLASFRVSSAKNRETNADDSRNFTGGFRTRPPVETNYLALAVLNQSLQIIQEIVVDASAVVHRLRDARLFALHGQIYVGSSGKLQRLWLTPPVTDSGVHDSVVLKHLWPEDGQSNRRIHAITIETTTSICSKDVTTRRGGKNLSYFVDANNDTVLELQPMGLYERIDTTSPCTKGLRRGAAAEFIQSNETLPFPSYGTSDELDLARLHVYSPPYTGERGSACCTAIQHPDGRSLLLGVSHSKTRSTRHSGNTTNSQLEANHFFSSFYAFESISPYSVVARSGKFCFGFSVESDQNPQTEMRTDTLKLFDQEYRCPRVHLVSGLVDQIDDPSKLIVSYGINDCVSRMVIIDKSDVLRMLFAPQALMDILS